MKIIFLMFLTSCLFSCTPQSNLKNEEVALKVKGTNEIIIYYKRNSGEIDNLSTLSKLNYGDVNSFLDTLTTLSYYIDPSEYAIKPKYKVEFAGTKYETVLLFEDSKPYFYLEHTIDEQIIRKAYQYKRKSKLDELFIELRELVDKDK